MSMLTIYVDPHTEVGLREICTSHGGEVVETASRLLARAVRAARPRPTFDTAAIKAANAPFVREDEMLAESGSTERADLLAQEDEA